MLRQLFRAALSLGAIAVASVAAAQTPVEFSAEARFQLDLHVPEAALDAMLPPGFTPNVATQGPAKDCNLRAIFVDRMTINGPDGKPVGKGSSRLVYLAAPVKDPSGANAQLVIGGLVDDPADAPGPFGDVPRGDDDSHDDSDRHQPVPAGAPLDSQDWVFQAPSGEHLELHIKYEHGSANHGQSVGGKFYSAKNPSTAQTLAAGTGARHPAQSDDESAG